MQSALNNISKEVSVISSQQGPVEQNMIGGAISKANAKYQCQVHALYVCICLIIDCRSLFISRNIASGLPMRAQDYDSCYTYPTVGRCLNRPTSISRPIITLLPQSGRVVLEPALPSHSLATVRRPASRLVHIGSVRAADQVSPSLPLSPPLPSAH